MVNVENVTGSKEAVTDRRKG